jgi:GNAT superfamily N-acetyltransferase
MTRLDIPDGMELKGYANWNQTEADWEFFLSANPKGCFVAEEAGRVVGTVTSIIYEERFAWIGMVLVHPEFRNRGIGNSLLQQAMDYLDGKGIVCMKLDATPQGKPIYEKLGFVSEYEIERWKLHRPARGAELGVPAPCAEDVLQWDREVFGADRSGLLRAISQTAPEFVQVLRAQGKAVGYAFGRHGAHSDQLGPWVAEGSSVAAQLLDSFLVRSARESVLVDCLPSHPWAREALRARGFEFARSLTRMHRGDNRYPGRPEVVCGILGPEFG